MTKELSTWTIEKLNSRKKLLTWSSRIIFFCLLIMLVAVAYLALAHNKYQQWGMLGVFGMIFLFMKTELQRIQTEIGSRGAK